jgi:hypothetical protein
MFLSPKAPFQPLACTAALGIQVRKYMKNAGVTAPRPGTHALRYSCAQRLLDNVQPPRLTRPRPAVPLQDAFTETADAHPSSPPTGNRAAVSILDFSSTGQDCGRHNTRGLPT